MKRLSSSILLCLLLSSSVFFLSCEKDNYEKGEGRYSLLLADFAYLTVNSEKTGVSFLTDEGENYQISNPQKASWIQTADTVYRAYLYYNKTDNGKARVTSMGSLPTLKPRDAKEFKRQPQDPLGLESSWLTRDGKYINLGLLLKNGRDDNGKEGTHALSLICDEVRQNDDQTQTAYYRLLHDQGNAPEYYTNRRYACILLPTEQRPDSVCLTVNTYDGVVVKKFKL
jgi:hypothetical protein